MSLIFTIGIQAFGSDHTTTIRENFSSFAVGSSPEAFSNNISLIFPDPFRTEIVEDDLPVTVSDGAKILSIKQDDSSILKVFELGFNTPSKESPESQMVIRFKLKINSLKNSKYAITLVDENLKNEEPTLVLNPSGYLNIFFATDSSLKKIERIDNPQGRPLREGQWYQFEFVVDLSTQVFQLNVEDLNSATGGSTENHILRRQLSAINKISFRPVNGAIREACIDWDITDIEVSQKPKE